MEDRRRQAAEKEAVARRATEKQILEDADHLITVWNERQAKRMPMLFSPTIGAAITAGYWFLRARCPACRTTGDVDLRTVDWHRDAAISSLTCPAVLIGGAFLFVEAHPRLPKNNPQALPPLPGGSLRARALGSGDARNIDGIRIRHESKRRLSASGQQCGVIVGTSASWNSPTGRRARSALARRVLAAVLICRSRCPN
jgi:hypothetical protein